MTAVSLMLAVPDAGAASAWYQSALGATELWNLGSVIGLELDGAPFFLAEPANNGWDSPATLGTTTVRVEVFVDDPDAFADSAAAAGANYHDPVRNHEMPWGTHRQGGFFDPYGHHSDDGGVRRREAGARPPPENPARHSSSAFGGRSRPRSA